ncbi:MAG: FmdB family zinc ribbon protein [Desulfovibrio fairfieldensis]
MPMYDFLCTACGEKFEELVAGDGASPACPKCGSNATERQMSVPSPLKTGAFPFKPGPVRPMGGVCPPAAHPPERAAAAAAAVS